MMRINQIMYENEPLSVGCAGKVEDGDNLTPVMLFDYYKNIFFSLLLPLPVSLIRPKISVLNKPMFPRWSLVCPRRNDSMSRKKIPSCGT